LICPRIVARIGQSTSLVIAVAMMAFGFAAIWLTSPTWVVALALFFEMFAALLWNVVTVSYRQRLIPDDLLGRVNSLYRFFGWGMMPFGALLGGWIVTIAAPDIGREAALRLPFLLAAGGMGVLWIYCVARLRL